MIDLLISAHLILCILLQIINMVKVTYQGQSENVIQILCSSYCCASGWFAFNWNAFLFSYKFGEKCFKALNMRIIYRFFVFKQCQVVISVSFNAQHFRIYLRMFLLTTKTKFLKWKPMIQECIPVECVPTAHWPYSRIGGGSPIFWKMDTPRHTTTPLWTEWQTGVKT